MALKKPSELFNKKSTLDKVQEQLEPEKNGNILDAFRAFKNNLNHTQTLSDFSSTFEGFKENFERVNSLYEEIEYLKKDVKNTIKKEDLDEAMMFHLLFVEKNIDSMYYDVLKKEVGYFEENISKKVEDLEVDIVVNEQHIHKIKNSVYEVLDNLKLDLIEEKSKELTEKISYVEEILEKFNKKTLLNEGLLNDNPNAKNNDPLTSLDQNYVTLQDLQEHYRLFINRVQQQLSTIGGGGAGFTYDLADVEFDRSTGNNKLLIYDQPNLKWVGIAATELTATALVDLTDVNASNLGDGRFLRYNASEGKFTFAPVSASNLELIAGDIQSGIKETNSTTPTPIMSISASIYRSAQYQVQVTEGTNYNMTTINIIHNGTETYMTEYGTINQPVGVATFSSDISSGSLRLIAHPSFASTTTFKVIFTALEV